MTQQENTSESSNGQTASSGARAHHYDSDEFDEFSARLCISVPKFYFSGVVHATGACRFNRHSLCSECFSLKRVHTNINKNDSPKKLLGEYFVLLSRAKPRDLQLKVESDLKYLKTCDDSFRNIFDKAYRKNKNVMSKDVRFSFSPMFSNVAKSVTLTRQKARDLKQAMLHAQGIDLPSCIGPMMTSIHERGACKDTMTMCVDCVSIRKMYDIVMTGVGCECDTYINTYMRLLAQMSPSYLTYVVRRDELNVDQMGIQFQSRFARGLDRHSDAFDEAGIGAIISRLRVKCTVECDYSRPVFTSTNGGQKWCTGFEPKRTQPLRAQGLWDGNFHFEVRHSIPSMDALVNMITGTLRAHNFDANVDLWARTLASLCIMLFQLCSEGPLHQKICGVLQFLLHIDLPGLNIHEYAQSLAQVFQGMVDRIVSPRLHAQGDSDVFDESVFSGTIKLILALSGITSYEQGINTKRVKKLDSLARMVTSWEKIYLFAMKMFDYAFTTICERVYGIRPEIVELDRLDQEIPQWMDDVSAYYNDNGLFRCTQSRAEALRVADWKRLADKYQQMVVRCRSSIPFPAQACFRNVYSMCLKMFDASQHFHSASSLRAAPLVLYLHGAAGIGKTITQHMLISAIMTVVMRERGEIYVPGRDVYTRNSTQEHWDAYNRQAVVIYDDYLQARDTTQMTEQLMDLLRIKNNQSWPLKMADLASKGNTYFDTELVLITSNVGIPADARVAVRSVTAIRRRVDLMIEQVLIPEYRNTINGALNRTKLARDFPPVDTGHGMIMADTTSIHRYNVRDPEERVLLANGTFEDLVELCLENYRAGHTQDAQMIGRLNWDAGLLPNGSARPLQAQGYVSDLASGAYSRVCALKESVWPSHMTDLEADEVVEAMAHARNVDPMVVGRWTYAQRELSDMIRRERERDSRTWRDYIPNFTRMMRKTWRNIKLIGFYNMFLLIMFTYLSINTLRGKTNKQRKAERRQMNLAEGNSGDEITRVQRSVLRVESGNSGDEKTRHQQSRIRAEGGCTTRPNVLVEEDGELHAQACSDMVAYNIAASKITNNAMVIQTCIPGTSRAHTMHALFVCGRTFIAPLHAYHELDIHNTRTILTNIHGLRLEFNTNECVVIVDETKDVVFIEIPKRFNNFVDIRSHFHTESSINKNTLKEAMLWIVDGENKTRMATYCTNLEADKILDYEVTQTTGDVDRVYLLKSYKYNGITRDGFCGAPLLWLNPSVQGGHILGIHVAGSDNTGLSNVLTREYVTKQTSGSVSIPVPELNAVNISLTAQRSVTEDTGLDYYGQVKAVEQIRSPDKTTILRSPLHGVFEPVTRPALLRPSGDLNPMRLGIQKQVAPLTLFDQHLVDIATDHLAHSILAKESKYRDTGVLSEHIALNGVPGDAWLTPMDMHTSPGYPYVLQRKRPGKYDFIDGVIGHYSLRHEIRVRLEHRVECARNGVIPWTLFIDHLKDERRPNAKVDIGKTRIFNIAPFDYNVMMRQYCQAFVAHIMSDHVYGECSVGINVHSDEWGMLYHHLRNLSDKWIGGDYGNYDKILSYQLLRSVCNIINRFYRDGNDQVREILFDTAFSAFHLVGRDVYRVHQGNPSGIVMTAVVNSLVNSIMMRIIYMELGGDITQFDDLVRLKTYGDDNIASVSPRACWFNMTSISAQFASHGIEYTNPDKSSVRDTIEDHYIALDNMSYLKRRFDVRAGRVYAPLARDSINEMINWIRASNDDKEAMCMNYLAACREMFHYGRAAWHEFVEHVTTYAQKKRFLLPYVTYEVSGEYWGSENPYGVILPPE